MTRPSAPIGIIAGGATLPGEVAESIVRGGGAVHILLIEGAADPALKSYPHTQTHWSRLGYATRELKRAGVRDLVMLGTFARPDLWKARPDFAFLRELPAIVRLVRAGGDDAVLRSTVALFERQGFRVVGVSDVAPDLVAQKGAMTRATPTSDDEADIALGFRLIDALGWQDIGQGAVISAGRIEAIEGAEGTDRMLTRVAERRRVAGDALRRGVLVKRSKPGQDMRVDMPTIGPGSVAAAAAASLAGIAVMSGHVLIAERPKLAQAAEGAGVFIVGRDALEKSDGGLLSIIRPTPLGDIDAPAGTRVDLVKAVRVMRILDEFSCGTATAVRENRVFAIGAAEPAEHVIERMRSHFKARGRAGVAALGPHSPLTDGVIAAAVAVGLAGIALVRTSDDIGRAPAGLIAAANASGLFVVEAPLEMEGSQP
ncbi:MAG: LpxI family protein [Hyphomicrobium sp.]